MSITEEQLAALEKEWRGRQHMTIDSRIQPAVLNGFFEATREIPSLVAELRATREQRDKALDQRTGLVDVLTQKARGYKERAEAAEAWAAALRAALERAKAFLLLARHPDLLGVLDAYSTIVDALAATMPAPAEPPRQSGQSDG